MIRGGDASAVVEGTVVSFRNVAVGGLLGEKSVRVNPRNFL